MIPFIDLKKEYSEISGQQRNLISDKKKQFDFLFVFTGIPIGSSGGERVLYSLIRCLSDHGYNVGLVLFLNPYRFIYKVTRNSSLLSHIRCWKTIKCAMFDQFSSAKFGYVLLYFFMKRIRVREHNFKDIAVVTPSLLRKLNFKRLIASPWETTYFVNYYNAECAKYSIIQYGDQPAVYAQEYLQGISLDLISQTFSFPLKKIVLNEEELKRFSADKPQKIQLGIDTSKFRQEIPFDKRNGKTILIPLRAPMEKGANCAIDAIKLIHRQRNDITIITYGNYRHTELIPDYVEHRGFVSDKELVDLYNSASIFVLPSLVELYSLSGLEAMACGCVLISTDTGATEYVKHNVNGIIVPKNDPNAIAEAVISLVDNRNQRAYLTLNGLETARARSEENMMRSFITAITNFEQGRH